jgi:hypothetical protein
MKAADIRMHEPEYFPKLFREAFIGRLLTFFLENNRKALVNMIPVNDSRRHFIHRHFQNRPHIVVVN